jgi:hypothetical protein
VAGRRWRIAALGPALSEVEWERNDKFQIHRANLDGSGVEDLAGTELSVPVGIALELGASVVTIAIDVKPGSFLNSINPKSQGVIPVAILTTDTFDVTTIDPSTVHFGATTTEAFPVHSALEDVDGDGDTDMVLHFETRATGIQCGDTSAPLTGKTLGGQVIEGADSIKTVGCE